MQKSSKFCSSVIFKNNLLKNRSLQCISVRDNSYEGELEKFVLAMDCYCPMPTCLCFFYVSRGPLRTHNGKEEYKYLHQYLRTYYTEDKNSCFFKSKHFASKTLKSSYFLKLKLSVGSKFEPKCHGFQLSDGDVPLLLKFRRSI